MDKYLLKEILEQVERGQIKATDAFDHLSAEYIEMDYAKPDLLRPITTGFPEVIFCQGKTPEQVTAIFSKLAAAHQTVLATRANREMYQSIIAQCPEAQYFELARCVVYGMPTQRPGDSDIVIVSAGTADMPVAEEAAVCAMAMGNRVDRLYDVGVAGIHRILYNVTAIREARVIIVVAGMEGALASVVGGLTDRPVIAVPTSVGYGASFGGLAALLAMLNSCASGVAVVNIDNGYGAAAMAGAIIRLANKTGGSI